MGEATHGYYIDDSGTKAYSTTGEYVFGQGETRYFTFGGLLLTHAEAGRLATELRNFKTACFGRPDVEIKANWLNRKEEREKRYLKKFNIDEERLRAFVDDVYALMAGSSCELIACIVDKAHMREAYGARAFYPPAVAYEYALQRVQNAMRDCKGRAHVVCDDMSGKTVKGREYRDNLARQHATLKANGSRLAPNVRLLFQNIEQLSFADSKADERLQLADLVAYAAYRQFVAHGPDWEGDQERLQLYEYFRRLVHRFRKDANGRVQGFGIVKAPRRGRRLWSVGAVRK